MRSVHVTRTIPAPAEEVFDRLADHANYDRFRPIHGSKLLRDGSPSPNGVGALREAIGGRPNVTVTEGYMGDGVSEAIVSTLASG